MVAALGFSVNREVREQSDRLAGVDRQGHPPTSTTWAPRSEILTAAML